MWEYVCCHRARLGVVRPPGARWRLLARCLSVPQHAIKPVHKQQAEAVSVKRRGANRGAPTRGLGYTGGIRRSQAVRARKGAAGCGIPAENCSRTPKSGFELVGKKVIFGFELVGTVRRPAPVAGRQSPSQVTCGRGGEATFLKARGSRRKIASPLLGHEKMVRSKGASVLSLIHI